MERFYGLWRVQLDKSVGFEEVAQLFGWTEERLKMVSSLEYTMLLQSCGERDRCFLDYGIVSTEYFYKLGEPFDFAGVDGQRQKWCTVTLEDGKLVETYVSEEGIKWRTDRELNGSNMKAITTFEISGAKCIQWLTKA
ncbi:unnamed protein product [Candidula unifasciata]|uniref:Uncharacterized protein n=1 Tax=Candidula unifasciata TaxID=100452 RepID=A0A8S3ZIT1_9EUPU|nr:unnamed protein product [Candidula unifasciata]